MGMLAAYDQSCMAVTCLLALPHSPLVYQTATEMVLTIALVNVVNRTNIDNFVQWSVENNISLLCMTESPKKPSYSGDYEIIHSPLEERGASILIIDRQLKYKAPFVRRRHVVIKIVGVQLLIHLWYIQPQVANSPEEEELEKLLGKTCTGVVHLGDLNARSKLLENTDTTRGRRLAEAVQRGNYVILNEPGVPTFRRHRSTETSIVDWVIVSDNIRTRAKLEVLPALFGTDHELLILTLAYKGEILEKSKLKVIAPGPFLRRIQQTTDDDDIAGWFEKLMDAVTHAQKVKIKRRPEPLTEELRVLRNQLEELLATIRSNRGTSSHLWAKYRELSALYSRRDREIKSRAKFDEIRRLKGRGFYAKYREISGKAKRVTKISHGDALLGGKEAGQLLLDHFFPPEAPDDYTLPENLPPDDEPLTKVEIDTAMKHFTANTAPGITGISFDLLKQWYSRKTNYFIKLLSDWYSSGIYPDELKNGLVIAIKKGNSAQATIGNVRPITLSETIARWYERIVDTRLMHYAESRQLLSLDQYGFRAGLSAEDAARRLQDIREANTERFELIIQTDVKSAFDRVTHSAIINALINARFPGNLIRIITSFIMERRASMMIGEDWVTTVVRRGVPQGSCLGPHLYILTTNVMLTALRDEMQRATSTKSELIAYADDVVLITSASNTNRVRNRGQSLVQTMNTELSRVGLTLSMDKLKFMMKGFPEGSTIHWNGVDRPLEPTMKILGITFSQEGNFHRHIQLMENKAIGLFQQYHSMVYSGLSADCRRLLALGAIAPKLNYGACVWYDRLDRDDQLALERITRIVGKMVTAAPYHAGKATVALLSKALPFHLNCQFRSEFAKKTASMKLSDELDLAFTRRDHPHPSTWKVRDFQPTVATTNAAARIAADLYLFTDGSRYQDEDGTHVGAAVVALNGDAPSESSVRTIHMLKLHDKNTVFQAELLAIKHACQEAEKSAPGTKVAILTDSLSSLQAIKQPTPQGKLVADCHDAIDRATSSGVLLTLHHVKAHVGIPGNEAADAAAKLAATNGETTRLRTPPAMVASDIKRKLYQTYDSWFKTKGAASAKDFFDGPLDPSLKRAKITSATSTLYSGHGWNLTSYRYGFKGAGSDCSCGQKQTSKHLLIDCPKYMGDNINAARKAGISHLDFTAPWNELRSHPRLHDYIYDRAQQLNRRVREDNFPYIVVRDLSVDLYKLSLKDEDNDVYPEETKYCLPIHSDRHLSEFHAIRGWHK